MGLLLLNVPRVILEKHLFESFIIGIIRFIQIFIFFLWDSLITGRLQLFCLVEELIELLQITEILQVI